MLQDPQLNRHFFHAFSDEMRKNASYASTAFRGVEGAAKKLITKRDLAAAAIGAGGLYGANRIIKDVAAGEQIRKQQAGGY